MDDRRIRSAWASNARRYVRPDETPQPPRPRPNSGALPVPQPPLADAVANARALKLPIRIGRATTSFWQRDVASINARVEAGFLTPDSAVAEIAETVSSADLDALGRLAARLSAADALFVHGALGFLASSLERHDRVRFGLGRRGFGLARLPGLEEALLIFAARTGRPPRDTAETAWLNNPPWSWTNSDGERRFGEGVRAAETLLGAAAAALLPLRRLEEPFAGGAALLGACAEKVEAYIETQREMAQRPFPSEFLAMRNFLGELVVNDQPHEGPNATYTAGWTCLDLAVGVHGDDYLKVATERTPKMPPHHRDAVLEGLKLPSIADLVADTLRIARRRFIDTSREELACAIKAHAGEARESIVQAARLARATARLSGAHWGVILANLINPVSALSPQERAKLGVDPSGGVSGTGLEHTNKMREERQKHPLAKPLAL